MLDILAEAMLALGATALLGFLAGIAYGRRLWWRPAEKPVEGRVGEQIALAGRVQLARGAMDVVKVYSSGGFRPVPLLQDLLGRLEGRQVSVSIEVIDPDERFEMEVL